MEDIKKPFPQPTSSPSGIWVAPSIPGEINSALTFAPTNNAILNPILPKEVIERDDADTLAISKYLFVGVVIAVFALVVIYFHRRNQASKANTDRGKYELVSVRETDNDGN